MKDEEIKHRWREYFDKMFNGENESTTIELDNSFDDTSMCFVRPIQESEVKEALKGMKRGKAMGPDCIPIEVWKGLRDIAIVWLKAFQPHFLTKQGARRMEAEYISTNHQEQGKCSELY